MRKPATRTRTPAAFVDAIVAGYGRRGIDPGPALRQAVVSQARDIGAVARVSIDAFEALSVRAMREMDDEALGWFGRRLPWGSYGMLLRASLTAPSLDVALKRWCRHHGLLADDVRLDLRVEAGVATVGIEERTGLGDLREFCLVSLLRNVHGVACWLVDSRIALEGVRFPFDAPAHAALYRHMFDGEIAFGASCAELSFDAIYLELPILRDDAALRRMLERPIGLMARQYRQDRQLSHRVARHIAAADVPADADAIARHLGTSVRSLQRHLRSEGTSLANLVSASRHRRAEDLLQSGDLPIKQIARLLGYSDESSFGRAFRQWTGRTPAQVRRESLDRARSAGRSGTRHGAPNPIHQG